MKKNTRASAAGRKVIRVEEKRLKKILLITLSTSLAVGLFIGILIGQNMVERFQPVKLDDFTIQAEPGDGMFSVADRAIVIVKAEYGFDKVTDSGRLTNKILPFNLDVGQKFTVEVTQTGQKTAEIWVNFDKPIY